MAHSGAVFQVEVEDTDIRTIPRQRILLHQQPFLEVVPPPAQTILSQIQKRLTLPTHTTPHQSRKQTHHHRTHTQKIVP